MAVVTICSDFGAPHTQIRSVIAVIFGPSPPKKKIKSVTVSSNFLMIKDVKVKVTQLCPTLCDPIVYTVHGILQPKILEWVAIFFSPLQGIFSTKGSNSGLPHCKRILYQLSHKRSPRILRNFSCGYFPFVCLFQKIVCPGLLPF